MEIPKTLYNEVWDYCRANSITNIDEFLLRILKQGFTIEKFGSAPSIATVDKIVEKIVEIPVEKEVYITDDAEVKKLTDKITELESRVSSLTIELSDEKAKNKKDLYGEG